MKIEVTLDDQPLAFIRRQTPDARKALREALHEVERGCWVPIALTDELEGFYKLRVGSFRLILHATERAGFRVIFAERRNVVYELFSQILGLE